MGVPRRGEGRWGRSFFFWGVMHFWTLVSVGRHAVLLPSERRHFWERWLYVPPTPGVEGWGQRFHPRGGSVLRLRGDHKSLTMWIVFVCELSSRGLKRGWQLGVSFKKTAPPKTYCVSIRFRRERCQFRCVFLFRPMFDGAALKGGHRLVFACHMAVWFIQTLAERVSVM